ncbi:ATP-dependent sacrificial sulfur transferase LarE [Clostridium sp. JNZ X4-2]
MNTKLKTLKENLKSLESVLIAFSGGVDSTFLLKVAHDVLQDKVLAVTATSSTYPKRELNEAKKYAKSIGVRHIIIPSEELDIKGYSQNPVNRCYYCKKELYSKLKKVAEENGIKFLLDGSNFDDIGDYRPGMKAARELGVLSPLKEAKLTKEDIRTYSKGMSLPTWNKPSFACLSSRFPYGNEINSKKLKMVEDAEQFLLDLDFKQVRVRHHGEIARIEVAPEERIKFFNLDMMNKVGKKLKELGFTYVTLDILGYKTGSMNAVLKKAVQIK